MPAGATPAFDRTTQPAMIRRNLFVRGALIGMMTGGAYGLVETLFLWLAPFAELPANAGLTAWHWRFNAVVIAGLLAAGAAAGALSGLAFQLFQRLKGERSVPQQDRFLLGSQLLILLLVYDFQILAVRGRRNEEYLLCGVITLILAAQLLYDLFTSDSRDRISQFLNPVSVPLLMLGLPWIRQSLLPHRDAGRFLVLGVLIALAAASPRLFRTNSAGWLKKSAVTLAVGAMVVAGLAGTLSSFRYLLLPLPPNPNAAAATPDVVLIVMDTTRADHLSVYGYPKPTTPHLEKFAAGATLYRRAVATSNYTLATHASVFTGDYPRRHGAHYLKQRNQSRRWSRPLSRGVLTLAEALCAKGYRTGAVSANVAFVTRAYNLDQGFEHFEAPRLNAGEFYLRRGIRRLLQYTGIPALERRYLSAADINRRATSLLKKLAAGAAPFFLFINYMDAHAPWAPPVEFARRFAGDARTLSYADLEQLRRIVKNKHRQLRPGERQALASRYDASLAYLDANLGRMLDHLKRIGRYRNSLIVILGDHGESLGGHHFIGHSRSLYQPVVHVPLLVKLPGQQEGRIVASPVSQVDVMPTILDALGLPLPPEMDGRSLLADSAPTERPVFAQWLVPGPSKLPGRMEHAIFFRDAKLIQSEQGVPRLFRP